MRKQLIAALLAMPLLVACESYSPSKQDIGMATGAVLGGVLGHQVGSGGGQTVATIAGAGLGAFLGSRIGAKMDRNDQLKTAEALETSCDGRALAAFGVSSCRSRYSTATHDRPVKAWRSDDD